MTKPVAEDTPLMGPSYQDVERQTDADFEEVQDIGPVRSSKSRLVLAAALLTGVAVASFGGGFRAETASMGPWGWTYGKEKSGGHHHEDHHKEVNATQAILDGEAKAEKEVSELQNEETTLKNDEAKKLADEKSKMEADNKKTISEDEKEFEAEENAKLAKNEKKLQAKLEKKLNEEVAELDSEIEAVNANEAQLKKQLEEEKQLEAKEAQIHASQQSLSSNTHNTVQDVDNEIGEEWFE